MPSGQSPVLVACLEIENGADRHLAARLVVLNAQIEDQLQQAVIGIALGGFLVGFQDAVTLKKLLETQLGLTGAQFALVVEDRPQVHLYFCTLSENARKAVLIRVAEQAIHVGDGILEQKETNQEHVCTSSKSGSRKDKHILYPILPRSAD